MTALGAIDPSVGDCVGRLTINSVDMHTPAWNVTTIVPLWYPPGNRGENVMITGLAGQVAYPLEVQQTDYILPMLISGIYDQDGNEDPDGVFARLHRNMRYLRDFVYGPSDGTTATWYATLDMPWGELGEAEVQVLDIGEVYHVVDLASTTMTVRVPAGEFEFSEVS